ncbi:MAG: hypothetical protein AUG46_03910 [Acidobacteria bacterium 13_1_20CM_3_58_11]|nr:MAG: hypothetical protein AUG46_03910 [Acidobacteria bacterium 13_1_20CM_3_58_11]
MNNSRAQKASEERHLATKEESRKLVAAISIGTEKIDPRVLAAEKVHSARQESQQPVTSPLQEKLHRMRLGRVFLILIKRTFAQSQRVHKGPHVEMAVCIEEMKPHGR